MNYFSCSFLMIFSSIVWQLLAKFGMWFTSIGLWLRSSNSHVESHSIFQLSRFNSLECPDPALHLPPGSRHEWASHFPWTWKWCNGISEKYCKVSCSTILVSPNRWRGNKLTKRWDLFMRNEIRLAPFTLVILWGNRWINMEDLKPFFSHQCL